jgi:hypothetical protein
MFLDLLVLAAIFRHYFPRCFVIHLQSNQKPSFFPPAVLVLAAFIRASGFIRFELLSASSQEISNFTPEM